MNRQLQGQFAGRQLVPCLPKARAGRTGAGKVYAREPPKRTKPNWKLEKKNRLVEGGEEVWYPGATPPAYLDGTLPGDRGFDPLRLAEKFRIGEGVEDGNGLPWLLEAELANGRIAMLASVGILSAEITGNGPWFTAVERANWPLPYWTGITAFHTVFAAYEWSRWQNFRDAGETGFIYAPFDPLVKANDYRRQSEVRNARLAMVAQTGFWSQAWATGKSPIDNLNDHLADPWGQNILNNARGSQLLVWLLCGGLALLFLEQGNAVGLRLDEQGKGGPRLAGQDSSPAPKPAKSEG